MLSSDEHNEAVDVFSEYPLHSNECPDECVHLVLSFGKAMN